MLATGRYSLGIFRDLILGAKIRSFCLNLFLMFQKFKQDFDRVYLSWCRNCQRTFSCQQPLETEGCINGGMFCSFSSPGTRLGG
jgi:hypothetical protein